MAFHTSVDLKGSPNIQEDVAYLESVLDKAGLAEGAPGFPLIFGYINGSQRNVAQVLAYGTLGVGDQMIEGQTADEVVSGNDEQFGPFHDPVYARDPAVIVYNGTLLEAIGHGQYVPVMGHSLRDALIAIISLKNHGQ